MVKQTWLQLSTPILYTYDPYLIALSKIQQRDWGQK